MPNCCFLHLALVNVPFNYRDFNCLVAYMYVSAARKWAIICYGSRKTFMIYCGCTIYTYLYIYKITSLIIILF